MDEPAISRKIVHIDMDAFYASVEQRDDPHLRGKPVVVAWKGNRSGVCAASYEARKFGVRSAMPAISAERLCPEAIFVPPDFVRYKEASRGAREIFHRHTDLIEPLSLDEAYLDVTENKTGLPTATRVAKTIRAQIREELNLTASAGVAPNKFLAKIASDWRKPDGLFVIQPHEVQDFLLPLPVGRIPGVGKVTESRMKAVGIATVGDLYRLELPDLESHHHAGFDIRHPHIAKYLEMSIRIFISMEDETGIANVIITPNLYDRDRLAITRSKFLLVEGALQNQDGVIHVKATALSVLSDQALKVHSHDFH